MLRTEKLQKWGLFEDIILLVWSLQPCFKPLETESISDIILLDCLRNYYEKTKVQLSRRFYWYEIIFMYVCGAVSWSGFVINVCQVWWYTQREIPKAGIRASGYGWNAVSVEVNYTSKWNEIHLHLNHRSRVSQKNVSIRCMRNSFIRQKRPVSLWR